MKFYQIFFPLILVLLLNSCSDDFLDIEAASSLPVSEYYTTEDRIFEALISAYDPLQWMDYGFGQYTQLSLISDIMGDDVYVGGSDENDCVYLHRMADYDALATSVCSDLWTTFYSGVNRSCIVTDYMKDVTDISEENKALYIAEAKVLRSFYYTWLWKLWGNVPYYDVNLEYPYTTDQYSADEVYNEIISTLEDAINNGGLPMQATTGEEGRITLAMAYMLYAEVVMYQQDETKYNQALAYMEEIINSGKYGLVDDFAGIWEQSGEWSKESIFEINYFSEGAGRTWSGAITEGGSVYPILIGIYNLVGSSTYATGWGFEPVRAEAYKLYDSTDQRRDGGILNFASYADTSGVTHEERYQDEGYFLNKYIARANGNDGYTGDADLNYNNNYRLYRYSETLLNAAELLLRGATGTGSAQNYFDEVRTRAGLSSVSVSLDNILKERRLEFLGEGKRYWDLIRFGEAQNYLVPNDYRTNTWSESKKYLPIPQDELDADGNLVQNDY